MKVGDLVKFKCTCGHSIPLTAIGVVVDIRIYWQGFNDQTEIDFLWNQKITKINKECLEAISNDR